MKAAKRRTSYIPKPPTAEDLADPFHVAELPRGMPQRRQGPRVHRTPRLSLAERYRDYLNEHEPDLCMEAAIKGHWRMRKWKTFRRDGTRMILRTTTRRGEIL